LQPADRLGRPLAFRPISKLFTVTIVFVMMAEVLIYVPSITNFQLKLAEGPPDGRANRALVVEAAPSGLVPDHLRLQILGSLDAKAAAIKTTRTQRLLGISHRLPAVARNLDMRHVSVVRAVIGSLEGLLFDEDDLVRVVGPAPMGGDFLEFVIEEEPLRRAMRRFSASIFLLFLVVSATTAMLIYFALHICLVRPMRQFHTTKLQGRCSPRT
jgi:hypothetical protein